MTTYASETQGFLSDVATGKSDIFKPKRTWKSLVSFNKFETYFKGIFDKYTGKFDMHIATSIPTFREVQIIVGAAIVNTFIKHRSALVYDIGGSEGGFCKAISEGSEGSIRTINLDPNSDMKAMHNKKPVAGSIFIQEAFHQGFDYEGIHYPTHQPIEKADVVHESMIFQFSNHERAVFIHHIKNDYLKPAGLFITEEKFVGSSSYNQNEAYKKTYKDQYYTKEQQEKKSETVLTGMQSDQADFDTYLMLLNRNFKYTAQYWMSGNFRGVVCSDNQKVLNEFMECTGVTYFKGVTQEGQRYTTPKIV